MGERQEQEAGCEDQVPPLPRQRQQSENRASLHSHWSLNTGQGADPQPWVGYVDGAHGRREPAAWGPHTDDRRALGSDQAPVRAMTPQDEVRPCLMMGPWLLCTVVTVGTSGWGSSDSSDEEVAPAGCGYF